MSERYRKVDIHLYLFPEESRMLNEKAKAAGMNRLDFLRAVIQDSTVVPIRKEDPEQFRNTTNLLCEVCDRLDKIETELIGIKNGSKSLGNLYERFSEIEAEYYRLAGEYEGLISRL